MRSNVCSLNAFSVEGKHIGCKQRAGVQNAIMVTLSARVLFYVNCFIPLTTMTVTCYHGLPNVDLQFVNFGTQIWHPGEGMPVKF